MIYRRDFLKTAAGAGALGFLSRLDPVSAAEARLDPGIVRFHPDIEPLVRLLEETPRNRLLEELGARVRNGLSYREVVAALLLAGIRNVQPRPSVGFKFHAVLVVHSAHLASLASPASERWLPIFWALDNFKSAQARDVQEGDWTMAAVKEDTVPGPDRARQAFIDAMDRWDPAAADVAAAGVARHLPPKAALDLFARYGARDFRSIGHKAIYVAGAWRLFETIGAQHTEPILRSLTYALMAHEGSDPTNGDALADRPVRRNKELLKEIRAVGDKVDAGATKEMLAALREGSWEDGSGKAVDLLNRGIAPQSIWDAVLAGSGELLMRQPGIPALHAVTTSNAMRWAFHAVEDGRTRRLLLLQAASFVPMFRRGEAKVLKLDELEAADAPASVEGIFADVGRDNLAAARKVLAYAKGPERAKEVMDAARRLVFLKGTDSHDYKFASAVLEDYAAVSPEWRDRFLASSVFWLKGSGAKDNALGERTRAALKG